jgi:hypothetical protein
MRLYYGVVENNVDEDKLGKVQVRIVGKHTENRTNPLATDYMPVSDLPWAQTLQTGSAISHESTLFSVPKNGTVVILSYIDDEEQLPIILGCVPKIPDTLPNFALGFSDPMGENPSLASLGTSPVSNYVTGNPTPVPVVTKKAAVEVGVQCNDEIWNEPVTEFDPDYPDNQVIQNGDNVLELDNTTGKERINLQHKSGTFKEIHSSGDQVVKINGKEYLIVEGDRNILVKGGNNLSVTAFNLDSDTEIKLKATTSITVDSSGTLTINAASGTIAIDGMLSVTASMISLN